MLILGTRLHLIDAFSSFVPFFDDWGMGGTLQEYESGELTLSFLLKPQNGHIGIWREFLQIFLFDLNHSQWDTQLQMVVNAVLWTIAGVFLLSVCARHINTALRWPAFAAISVLWLFPTSITNAIWGVQTHSYFMVLLTVLAFWFSTAQPLSRSWFLGILFALAAPLSMGGGNLVGPAILSVLLARFIFDPSSRKTLIPCIAILSIVTAYCVWIISFSSTADAVMWKAESLTSFIKTLLKALSYPNHEGMWPSLVLLLPLLILSYKVIFAGDWSSRLVLFVLTLFSYTLALCLTIAYARGLNGLPPASRYFEFLQLYTLASFLALLLLQSKPYKLQKPANKALITLWLATIAFGAVTQTQFLTHRLSNYALEKPMQEAAVLEYLHTGKKNLIETLPKKYVPYPSRHGMVHFIDKVSQEDIFSYKLQRPAPLSAEENSTAFINNGTVRRGQIGYRYQYEDVIGSYDPQSGGMAADGTFVSQILATNRKQLVIPVTGYLGYPDLHLQIYDLATEEYTSIKPKRLGNNAAEQWQEIFVDAPENGFRIIATDNNPDLWFGFAAPRTVGVISVGSNWLIRNGLWIWLLGLSILAIFLSRSMNRP